MDAETDKTGQDTRLEELSSIYQELDENGKKESVKIVEDCLEKIDKKKALV